jgi:hypothetical protein
MPAHLACSPGVWYRSWQAGCKPFAALPVALSGGRLVKAGALSKELEARLSRLSAAAELLGYAGSLWLSAIKLRALLAQEAATRAALEKLRKVGRRAATERRLSHRVSGARVGRPDVLRRACIPPCLASPAYHFRRPTQEEGVTEPMLEAKARALRLAVVLRCCALAQDLADVVMATNDVTGGESLLRTAGRAEAAAGVGRGGPDPELWPAGGRAGGAIKGLNDPLLLAVAGLTSGGLSFYKNWVTT